MKILLATDGSEYSENAARFLARVPWSQDDSLTVFHAIYAVPFREDETFHFNTLKAIKKDLAPKIIDSTLAVLGHVQANISADIEEFTPGQSAPERCIIETAASSGTDLIVMGARGTRGIGSLLIGSVTKSVAIHSPIPVLIVKQTPHPEPDAMKILFATDGSDASRAAGASLSSIPFQDNAELTILNIISPAFFDVPKRFRPEIFEQSKDAVERVQALEAEESKQVLEQTEKQLNNRFKHVRVLAKTGDPSAEILKTAEALEADLIVLGSRGLRGIKGALGSVSRNVLAHAPCSILIGKILQE